MPSHPTVTIIGRGHSGTRAIAHTLAASGVFMGYPLNKAGDLIPADELYAACWLLAGYVDWLGDLEWSWSAVQAMDIPAEFVQLIDRYLDSVWRSSAAHTGWKLPETTLVFPWIARLYPEMRYIHWIRDPRDCIMGEHQTDDLANFGLAYPPTDHLRRRRAISWKYQYDLVRATPRPKYWLDVRFEDFVLKQDETLARLEDFLGLRLAKTPVNPEAVGRWRIDPAGTYFDFFAPMLAQYGYAPPEL